MNRCVRVLTSKKSKKVPAIINIFIISSLSICKNLVLVSHNFRIRNCTNLDNVWMGYSCRSHYGFSSMHTACDHKWSLDNKVVFMMCLYSHVRNESISGNSYKIYFYCFTAFILHRSSVFELLNRFILSFYEQKMFHFTFLQPVPRIY